MESKRKTRRPRVLYLSFFFPPSRASGVYRGRATANHLAAAGWDVTVFTAPMRFLHEVTGNTDESLAKTVNPEISVVRPRLSLYAWEKDLRRIGRFQAMMPVLSKKMHRFVQRKTFPEAYTSWGTAAVRRALTMHVKRPFDVVLATGNPFASLAAAWLFHRLTGVPYIVDYRDSWTLDLFNDSPAFPRNHIAWRWERRILGKASAAVFVNEALRGWHAEQYPDVADRMMVVPNGWDPDLVGAEGLTHTAQPNDPDRPLRFGYLGTMSRFQPVQEMVDAFRQARQHPELASAELNVYGHLGFFPADSADLKKILARDDHVHYRGSVSKTDVARVYEESDVLVFLAGGGRYVTSGKIFEYMAAGKPIVSVHAPGIAAKDVLDGYPLWFNPDSLDPARIAEAMVQAGKAAREMKLDQVTSAQEHALAYSRDKLLVPLEARLRSLVQR